MATLHRRSENRGPGYGEFAIDIRVLGPLVVTQVGYTVDAIDISVICRDGVVTEPWAYALLADMRGYLMDAGRGPDDAPAKSR